MAKKPDDALSIDELDARSVALKLTKAAMLTWVSDMAKG
jgi:hypothetical protein